MPASNNNATQQRPLYLYNSLTRQKEEFIPLNKDKILWYACGPTVYDHSHLGHARTYVTQDLIRRLMSTYFNYNIQFVMNITDIDDKIIQRGRQEHLLESLMAKSLTKDVLKTHLNSGIKLLKEQLKKIVDPAKKKVVQDSIELGKANVKTLDTSKVSKAKLAEMAQASNHVLMTSLDAEQGHECNDNEIFTKFSQKYEASFFEDFDTLNVLRPDALTRVSEYVPEIVDYIKTIVDKGFAYESNKSVYFDVKAFLSKNASDGSKHEYPKLVPEAAADAELLAEGEGELSTGGEKKNKVDFALWKAHLPGQPSWPSPWGRGRPGWHIECSVMSQCLNGAQNDIHSGGIDLKFPHHDNEIAQCEAYNDANRWTNYFLHMGHLHISGLKMSKSLKNFITIKEMLRTVTPDQIRVLCMLSPWHGSIDYSQKSLAEAKSLEESFHEFFAMAVKLTSNTEQKFQLKLNETDIKFLDEFNVQRSKWLESIADNMDLREALFALRAIVKAFWVYIKGNAQINLNLINTIKDYVGTTLENAGFLSMNKSEITSQDKSSNKVSNGQLLDIIADFRNKVRIGAMEAKNYDLLKVCDQIRDETLPQLGIKVSDTEHGTVIKFVEN